MDYKHHNCIINERTIEDIQNYNKKEIKKNFEDLDYLKAFLKKFAIKHYEQLTSASKLYGIFYNEFEDYEINYNIFPEETKKKYISKYKKQKIFIFK